MTRKHKRARDEAGKETQVELTPKSVWHPMNLQQMALGKFVSVVNRILEGKHSIVAGSLRGTSTLPRDEET